MLQGVGDEEFVVKIELLDEQDDVESAFTSAVLLTEQGATELERWTTFDVEDAAERNVEVEVDDPL